MVIRPFLPESPVWLEKKRAGTLRHPSVLELLRPGLRQTTLVTTVMFACAYAASFGALLHAPRIVPGMDEMALVSRVQQEQTVSGVQFAQEMGECERNLVGN